MTNSIKFWVDFQCSLALSKNSSHACSFAPRGSLSILLNFSLEVLLITVAVHSRRRNKLWSFKKLLRFTRVYNRRMLDDRLVYMIWRLLWKHGGEKLHLPIYLSTTVFIIQRVNSFIKFKSSFVKRHIPIVRADDGCMRIEIKQRKLLLIQHSTTAST